ncbi:MAG: response regulator [Candidatus Omnitrophota bacterium]|nr:response regulator [Candidatus Omnitrophota bacterium]
MAKKKILLVDDEEDIIKMNMVRLIDSDYDVILATDGKDALKKAESQHPDLILLDVMMPCMDGLKALAALKENPETLSIPVIMLTALVEDAVVNKAKLIGAVDFIEKPFNAEMLIEAVKKYIS